MFFRNEPENGQPETRDGQKPAGRQQPQPPAGIRILLLEDDAADAELVERKLKQEGLDCVLTHAKGQDDFEAALARGSFDLIISDYRLPGFNGLVALEIAKHKAPASPFVFVSGTLGEEAAIESLQRGATDYVLKDRLARLGPAIRRALKESADRAAKQNLEAQFLRAQRMETIGALAGGIAHDLNNALAPILMGIDLLKEDSPAEARALLSTMRTCAERGAEMVKQILSFSRGVSGESALLNVKHLIYEMEKLVKEAFPRSIAVRTKIDLPLYPIKGNATQLYQLLLNLCVNARDAMPQGGALTIEATNITLENAVTAWKAQPVSGPHVLVSVSDTGQGMSAEVQGRIFEPFFTTKPAGKGSGLGLSTVKGIVKSHDGFVEVWSKEGKGSAFKIYLPAAATGEVLPPELARPALPAGRGETILVIDDEIGVLEMIRETLEAFGYRVLTARHGGEAIALYHQYRGEIRALISDMMMPVMDGPTTIKTLRKIDPTLKVIGMTGLGSDATLVEKGRLEVQAFVKKPFSVEELLVTLRQMLDGEMRNGVVTV
ncbi:MAG TPA: response regulator [Verrucomicrobiae bacterium]|nr:response regulator [Verrucomicrobiae bacterium]